MMVFETIGLFIVTLGCILVLALIWSFFMSGDVTDEKSFEIGFFGVIVVLLLIASIYLVQFRHYPEKFGYTAIEEVEEVESEE